MRRTLAFKPIAAIFVVSICLALCGGSIPVWMLLLRPHHTTVARVSHTERALQAAADTAKRSLPQFVERLKHKKPGESFAIKAKLVGGSGPEYLWVRDPIQTASGFQGRLDQPPADIPSRHKGDPISVATADVWDWLIKEPDGKLEGGYTDAALGSPVR